MAAGSFENGGIYYLTISERIMKLDDFLKVKKVRCVKAYDDCLKAGKEYSVLDIRTEVKVKDDEGDNHYWESDYFEPVLEPVVNQLQNIELTPKFETETSEPTFEVGDKVYKYGETDVKTVLEVFENGYMRISNYPHRVNHEVLCHATPENHAMLSKPYPHIEFEQPTKPLSGDDIVRAMLKKGIKNVLCLWGNGDKIIIDRLDYKGSLMSTNCNIVGGLTPIDWYTGEPLTESVLND